MVIAGSAEAKVNAMAFMRQTFLKRLCTTGNDAPGAACRPFDAAHNGTVLGEGGGLVVLEELERARARGARIYAEFAGFGAACDPDAIELTAANVGSLDLAVRRALKDAGVSAADVSAIAAHGTGVPAEDARESTAWRAALGDRAATAPAFALSGSIGALFAGAGGVLAAAAAMTLHDQSVPPTVNFVSAADDCPLNLSPHDRPGPLEFVAAGAFTTGGQSAACVWRRYRP